MKNRGSSSADINPGIVLIWESCLPPFVVFSVIVALCSQEVCFLDLADPGCCLSSWFGECLQFGTSAPSALFLLVVPSIFCRVVFLPILSFPFEASSPRTALDDGK